MKKRNRVGIGIVMTALIVSVPLVTVEVVAEPIIGGFIESAQAVRVDKNEALGDGELGDRTYPRNEFRMQATARDESDLGAFFARIDFLSDASRTSRSSVDVREAYVKLYPARWLDIKLGRQVATWGTGDLVFANDLFAKDWEAFFTGLDDSYLKPPQDLLRMSFYLKGITAEVAASPSFTPDMLPDGQRLSLYNPFSGTAANKMTGPMIQTPSSDVSHGELFGRVSGYQGSFEWALYGYRGFWPTPQGVAMRDEIPALIYPRLWSSGASLRGPVGSFLAHVEGAAYISQDDLDGDDPMIANSQLRGFAGLEKSLGNDWTVGGQYYVEKILDYEVYENGFGGGEPLFEELRSTVTMRVTKFMLGQNLMLSGFGYYGVTDEDYHLRLSTRYKVSDAVAATVGANLIDGDQPHTMFGQFRDNSNVYLRLRYSF